MGDEVYANGMAIAAKVGGGKVIAAFPDVCMSPPPPPAGPIPIPYPNSSFSKDLKKGSKAVKIGGKPMALKDSFYKTSPLGNEAATKSFGGSMLSHQTSGKTEFIAYSFDVKVEGKNVCRHVDGVLSNCASMPGLPSANLETLSPATVEKAEKNPMLCPCCDGDKHAEGKAQSGQEWYESELDKQHANNVENVKASNPLGSGKKIKKRAKKIRAKELDHLARKEKLTELLDDATKRPGCVCPKPAPNILPTAPCDTFYEVQDDEALRKKQAADIKGAWMGMKANAFKQLPKDRPPVLRTMEGGDEYMHKTPQAAGGCPTGGGNLQKKKDICGPCQKIDSGFNDFQGGWR